MSSSTSESPSADLPVDRPEYLWEFAEDQADLAAAARELNVYLRELAQAASITVHTIEARSKGLASYWKKASKQLSVGSQRYIDPQRQILDSIAARVIVFTTRARHDMADVLLARTDITERHNPGELKYNGYDSDHIIVRRIKDADARDRYPTLAWFLDKYPGLEVQLRSVAAHAWAEYEHDIRYKSAAYESLAENQQKQIDQWFVEAGGMRRVMDQLFAQIERLIFPTDAPATQSNVRSNPPPVPALPGHHSASKPLTEESLSSLISQRFPEFDKGSDGILARLVRQLTMLGVNSIAHLEEALTLIGEEQVAGLMSYPGRVSGARRLEDEILAVYEDKYADAANDEETRQLLRLRLRRVRGKFAIYALERDGQRGELLTAASAIRELVERVTSDAGLEATLIDGAVVDRLDSLPQSARPRQVATARGTLFIATNLSRAAAEGIMRELTGRICGSHLRVLRAGEVLFESTEQ